MLIVDHLYEVLSTKSSSVKKLVKEKREMKQDEEEDALTIIRQYFLAKVKTNIPLLTYDRKERQTIK